MKKQNKQVVISDIGSSYDQAQAIELHPLRDKNKKMFNRLVSETFVTNLANSKKKLLEKSVDIKAEIINDFLERAYGTGHNIYLEIVEKKTGTTVGFLWYRLHNEQLYSDMAYICSICILPPYRKKGYATIALKSLGKYLKEEKDIVRIALMVSAHNGAAIRLYESAGFESIELIMHKLL
jgi:ribosomal protein S18 acetylase RimI-like enzyme